jgi:hypothetical protein
MAIKHRTAAGLLLAVTAAAALAGCGGSDTATSTGAGLWGATSGSGYTVGERAYLETLDDGDIAYSSEESALDAGDAICDFLRAGGSSLAAVDVVVDNTGYTAFEAGYLVGAAQGALCPDMAGA